MTEVEASAASKLKHAYATTAQAAGKALTRVGVIGDDPPPRSKRLRHWAYSLTKAHDSIGMSELDVPWWTYGAIDAVERWIQGHSSDIRTFEWGSGASTIWLAKRVAEVHSVEHHRGFGELIGERLATVPNATLDIVEPTVSEAPTVASAKEGHGRFDFAAYVGHIGEVGGKFDLIVIDGRAREACLETGLEQLAEGGMIVFDNTLRRRYRAAIGAAPVRETVHRGLTPTLPYPDQTSLLTR